MNNILAWDKSTFLTIHQLAGQSSLLDAFGVFLAHGLIFIMVGMVVIFAVIRAIRTHGPNFARMRNAAHILFISAFSAISAYGVKVLMSVILFRPRPYLALSNITPLLLPVSNHAFPSGHASVAFAMAMTVWWYSKKWGSLMLVLAAFVSFGRVFVGVHYPIDVIIGAFSGMLFAVLIASLYDRVLARHR